MWVQKQFSSSGVSTDNPKITLAAWLTKLEEQYYIEDKLILQDGSVVAVKVVANSAPGMRVDLNMAKTERIAAIFEEN
jgi:hypothetical protein